ncbi:MULTISPECIES: DUF5994 family protein [Streptomyces]|uniref:Uncharacterized protein n=1 Tax=Streptomyces chartreusis NRRL 3882 TaxID=1079985 RepID=A0A2N9BAR3_STRCX|nr:MULTISPECIES: DUF5994 family protein [Streptomyces]MYS91338.1 hypothetical protein [Streptomyces sp. SID5464]SOR80442.1 hypothetical protein SCNRRL3882_3897 [Streptomyces chartreusis NRRL 3882]
MTSASSPPPPLPAPSEVRLRLAVQPRLGRTARRIDGAWWPRSYDLAAELPGLLAVLPRAWGRVSSVLVHGDTWLACPDRLDVAGREVHVGRRDAPTTPDTVCLLTPGRGRWDLLVVPPATTEAEAVRLMEQAVSQDA